MDANLTTNILNILLSVVFFIIALRAFYLYFRIRSARLFMLGLSMIIIALTATADFAATVLKGIQLHTDWFLFVGQTICFVFILLSVVVDSEDVLRKLMRWHIVVSIVLLLPLILSPTLPDVPSPGVQTILSGLRSVICFVILFYYVGVFMSKESRFALLMMAAFFLLSFGYLVLLPTYVLPHEELLDHIGDIMRIGGVVTLLTGFVAG